MVLTETEIAVRQKIMTRLIPNPRIMTDEQLAELYDAVVEEMTRRDIWHYVHGE